MSRYYNMAVAITGVAGPHHNAVREAAEDAWEFGDWYFNEAGVLMASGSGNLCAGETEEEFAERMAKAIWAANGDYCKVEVNAAYLEELSYETHCLEEHDYRGLMPPPEVAKDGPSAQGGHDG